MLIAPMVSLFPLLKRASFFFAVSQTYIPIPGPETHITAIVPLALGIEPVARPSGSVSKRASTQDLATQDEEEEETKASEGTTVEAPTVVISPKQRSASLPWYSLFTPSSRAFIYGMQPK